MLQHPYYSSLIEAGCDEAGRGPLAGSVFAAAVILPDDFKNEMLNDSKKLSASKREYLKEIIIEKALAWSVSEVSHVEIDEINILNASFLAMNRAVSCLKLTPQILLIDGNRFRTDLNIPYECIIKGDGKVASIAAASILAKCYRDEQMINLSQLYPEYGWDKNMGYPTKAHVAAIEQYGLTPYHRLTYAPCEKFLKTI